MEQNWYTRYLKIPSHLVGLVGVLIWELSSRRSGFSMMGNYLKYNVQCYGKITKAGILWPFSTKMFRVLIMAAKAKWTCEFNGRKSKWFAQRQRPLLLKSTGTAMGAKGCLNRRRKTENKPLPDQKMDERWPTHDCQLQESMIGKISWIMALRIVPSKQSAAIRRLSPWRPDPMVNNEIRMGNRRRV